MAAVASMPRNDLIGLRMTPEELELLDRVAEHLTATSTLGVRFTRQMVLKAGLVAVAAQAGLTPGAPTAPPSRPRVKKSRK